MCCGTTLLLPYLVSFGKQERFTEKVLDNSLKRSRFISEGIFRPEYISDNAWILNKELDLAAKVHQHYRVLVRIKAIKSFGRVVLIEKPAEDWLGRFELLLFMFLLQVLIRQHRFGITKEEVVIAT